MSKFTVVYCDLNDCLYYSPEPDFPRKCRCTHPDKPTVMNLVKCPLYRMEWEKRSANLNFSPAKKVAPPPTKGKPIKKYGQDED